jgi:hypothetical protein
MSSNQRPDTLMQDRIAQIDEIFLHCTAGPYIRVKSGTTQSKYISSALPLPAQAIDATQTLNRSAGVWKRKVLRGRSLSCRATLLSSACV